MSFVDSARRHFKPAAAVVLLLAGVAVTGIANANLIQNDNFESGVNNPWIFSGNTFVSSSPGTSADFWFGGGTDSQQGKRGRI